MKFGTSIPSTNTKAITNLMSITDSHREMDGLQRLDSQVIAAIYDRYFPDVYRYVFYRLGDNSLAEDITSDVFIRLLEAVKKKQGPQTNIRGWLISTASNIVADHLRRAYRRPTEIFTLTLCQTIHLPFRMKLIAGNEPIHFDWLMRNLHPINKMCWHCVLVTGTPWKIRQQ